MSNPRWKNKLGVIFSIDGSEKEYPRLSDEHLINILRQYQREEVWCSEKTLRNLLAEAAIRALNNSNSKSNEDEIREPLQELNETICNDKKGKRNGRIFHRT